jgi:cytochrome b subunit of formate dehydrogenase
VSGLFLKAMLPPFKDATDMLQVLSYNLGLTKIEPRFAKFNYAEKLERSGLPVGTALMTVSGVLLWFNHLTPRYLPRWVFSEPPDTARSSKYNCCFPA